MSESLVLLALDEGSRNDNQPAAPGASGGYELNDLQPPPLDGDVEYRQPLAVLASVRSELSSLACMENDARGFGKIARLSMIETGGYELCTDKLKAVLKDMGRDSALQDLKKTIFG